MLEPEGAVPMLEPNFISTTSILYQSTSQPNCISTISILYQSTSQPNYISTISILYQSTSQPDYISLPPSLRLIALMQARRGGLLGGG